MVYCVSHHAPPSWTDASLPWILVPTNDLYARYIGPVDVAVTMFWTDILGTVHGRQKLTVHFEQGDETLFDPKSFPRSIEERMQKSFRSPVELVCVSSKVRSTVRERFGRDAEVIPPGLNRSVFYPKKTLGELHDPIRVLAVGSRRNRFKNIDKIEKAVRILRDEGMNIGLVHVTQDYPDWPQESAILSVFQQPAESYLGEIYRKSDILVSASDYESFSLPPLEAMACGTPVVSTDNGGITTYARADEAFRLSVSSDPLTLASSIKDVICDAKLRFSLVENGLKVAERFSWDHTLSEFERYFLAKIARVGNALQSRQNSSSGNGNELLVTATELWRWGECDYVAELVEAGIVREEDIVNRVHVLSMEYIQGRDLEPAYRMLRECNRFMAKQADTWYNLAFVCWLKKDFAEATFWAEKVLQQAPDDVQAREMLKSIQDSAASGPRP